MKVDFEQLLSFGNVATELSFSRAAAKLNLDQSRVSRHIQALEKRVGCALFTRTTRHVALTPEGTRLLEAIRPLQFATAHAAQALDLLVSGLDHQIRVGIPASLGADKRTALFARFSRRFPQVKLTIQYGTTAELLALLNNDSLDMAFVNQPINPAGLEVVKFQRHPLMVLLPASDELADREQVPLELLVGRKVGLVPQGHISPEISAYIEEKMLEAHATILPVYDLAPAAIYHSGRDEGICYVLFSPTDSLPPPIGGLVARSVDRDVLWRESCIVHRTSLRNKWIDWFFQTVREDAPPRTDEEGSIYALSYE